MSCRIVVVFLSGHCHELDVDQKDSIAQVKDVIASKWRIPQSCQRLLNASSVEILDDSQAIIPDQQYQLILTVDDICKTIVRGCVEQCFIALRDLRVLSDTGYNCAASPDTFIAIFALIQQTKYADLRLEAVKTLAQIATKGDCDVINPLLKQLSDIDCDVRIAVVQTIAQLAEKGDHDVINQLLGRLTHHDCTFRLQIVLAVGQLSAKGDRKVIDQLFALLENEYPDMQLAAVRAIAQIAEQGDQKVIDQFSSRLEHHGAHLQFFLESAIAQLSDDPTGIEFDGACFCY
mmetsp:Transcript_3537/g.6396  ORF Transcript_3537/g.6396 Transcript_3537/m.6396 type:complete len:290 (-) Transcript_3537:65-934(-)